MYIFNIPKISTSHEYYHTTIITYQSTHTSPQIHIIMTFTKISPMHIFTKSRIQV